MDLKWSLRFVAVTASLLSGCAVLYHAQVGMVDNRNGASAVPFEVMISETGVSLEQAGKIAKATNTEAGKNAKAVTDIIGLFQIGPRTGNPVYNEHYAEKLIYEIHQKCPSGKVTGLMSIREMREYPVISGEIVKVTGYCLKTRATASETAESNDLEEMM